MATFRPARGRSPSRATVAPAPSAYVPVRHPGVPRSWDRAAILRALADWVGETGAPPRRVDWSGERPEHAGAAQRKWMREHPRWPSSSCVAGHFGSWSAALEAADLPARRLTFDSSVAERVQAARRLAAAGLGLRAIAQTLEVSVSSVGNYLRARDCPDCRGPVTSPRATRCADCTVREPTVARAWTRSAVCEAIREWDAEHGRPPTYHEWTPSRARPGVWEAQSPRWPSAAVVCDCYRDRADPWNAAFVDAGVTVRFQRWSDDAVRAALAGFWARTGRAPTLADLHDAAWDGPRASTLRRRYGGVAAAWRALGPAPAEADA
jgi:hypothetical protein